MPSRPWKRNLTIAMLLFVSYLVGMIAAYQTTEFLRRFRTDTARPALASESGNGSAVADRN